MKRLLQLEICILNKSVRLQIMVWGADDSGLTRRKLTRTGIPFGEESGVFPVGVFFGGGIYGGCHVFFLPFF